MFARAFLLLFIFTMIAGCSSFKMVGQFDDFDENLIGSITANHIGGAANIKLKATKSGFTCEGTSRPTYMPPSFTCANQEGVGSLMCSDGRRLEIKYYTRSCTTGWGSGQDQQGTGFSFVFGYNEAEANAELSRIAAQDKDAPALPTYNPKETRKKQGFSTGTGFYVTTNGILVTNYHVIDGAKSITIVHSDTGRKYSAKLIGADPANDVAVLQTSASSKPAPVSIHFDAKRGEEIFTLGYPLTSIQGQEQKATFGRVNALSGAEDDFRFTQVDVPIQPGNSGGPLFNRKGEVIGIITATLNQKNTLDASGSLPQNVNYAVKIDYVLPLLRSSVPDLSGPQQVTDGQLKDIPSLIELREESVVMIVAE